MAYVIFDLDHTVIDSSHRQATLPSGDLNLEHWFDNARPHLIAQDSLLPLARSMRAIYRAGHFVIICTARAMQAADFEFLARNDLPYHHIIYRRHNGICPERNRPLNCDMRSDATLKAEELELFFRSKGFACAGDANAIMFDDNPNVVTKMLTIGITCLNARNVNANMRLAA